MLNHIELAKECGFSLPDGTGLEGDSDLDESIYCGEYPIGEALTAFANAIIEECAKVADDSDLVITADNIRALRVKG